MFLSAHLYRLFHTLSITSSLKLFAHLGDNSTIIAKWRLLTAYLYNLYHTYSTINMSKKVSKISKELNLKPLKCHVLFINSMTYEWLLCHVKWFIQLGLLLYHVLFRQIPSLFKPNKYYICLFQVLHHQKRCQKCQRLGSLEKLDVLNLAWQWKPSMTWSLNWPQTSLKPCTITPAPTQNLPKIKPPNLLNSPQNKLKTDEITQAQVQKKSQTHQISMKPT